MLILLEISTALYLDCGFQSKPVVSQWHLFDLSDRTVCKLLHSVLPEKEQKVRVNSAPDSCV